MASKASAARADEGAVILLLLVGGPSQLETWDPKPDEPAEVRGPFRSIATALPGVRVCEHLPRLARRMDRLTVIRSLHHDAAPIHETGYQLLQNGRLSRPGDEPPHIGSVAARELGPRGGLPPFVLIPRTIGHTGVGISRGQSAGRFGRAYEPFHVAADPTASKYPPDALYDRARLFLDVSAGPRPGSRPGRRAPGAFDLSREPDRLRDAYGRTRFGQECLLACRLVEAGVRLVTVNMYTTVFDRVSWDCHGTGPFSTLDDYSREVLPTFDRAFSALVDDLDARGLLATTLVVATGEFGRTPRLNSAGGRDHWPGVWSAALAGGGLPGGRVLGASDAHASEPVDDPFTPADLFAMMADRLGIRPASV
jgi:hypothetical protein